MTCLPDWRTWFGLACHGVVVVECGENLDKLEGKSKFVSGRNNGVSHLQLY